MSIIPKGLTHENLKVLLSLNFLEKDLYMMFNYILKGKKRLSRLLKCQSNIVWKCPFFIRGYPLIFVRNRTFLPSLIFFGIDLHMMFKCILNEKKKHFLDYKNVILTYWENVHFSKGGNSWFSSKIWKFFSVSFSLRKT